MSAHNYHPGCGCADCCRTQAADERRDEWIDSLLADESWCAAHVKDADENVDGTHDGNWYSDAERALADLSGIDADKLLGSDVLARLYRLAEVANEARKSEMRAIAEAEVDAHRSAA